MNYRDAHIGFLTIKQKFELIKLVNIKLASLFKVNANYFRR